ncbi:DUF5623 domain-containing protein [Mesorhizobium sp. VK9D]|uniref:DUF5623 domain-containing protein n=1 Tax=Mesorhizobium australafricanum TaxID=3072311 RepID=UPI002A249F6A|nr:DUF5623 domain-containing protein [Mesorhizobium sp. VK9D]MDX8455197.1 DUF5623 domain-containing protein [Mesorhizobium sp. VK9D]
MLIGDVRPTTLDGVKSLAAELRKERGIKDAIALDLAAQAANFSNFRNAKRLLPKKAEEVAPPYVLLSIYWSDKEQKYTCGRETLKVELSRPILEICGRYALKKVRGFGNLRMVADDHFICDDLAPSQEHARERLCTAERSIRFMEHTTLRPPRSSREAHPRALAHDSLPSRDHSTAWIDAANGQFILIDEPYGGAPDEIKRAAWAARTGWRIVKTAWPGMYRPHECDLYIATDARSGYDLDALAAKIDSMPPPLIAESWSGESSPSWDTFVSPLAKTAQDVRRARCRGMVYPNASATSVPYSYQLGSTRRRPVGELGVAGHIDAGSIIKAVLTWRHRPSGVWSRLSPLRSTLEDWMELERRRGELDGPEFFQVYYGDTVANKDHLEKAKSREGVIWMLGELKAQLQKAYSDCAPLRRQLHRIEMSISLINK